MKHTHRATRHTMPRTARAAMIDLLHASLADALDLQLKSKQAHWNVRGPNFSGLHDLFDKAAEAAEGFADDLAERSTALGGCPMGDASSIVKNSRLPALCRPDQNWKAQTAALAACLAAFGDTSRAAIDSAAAAGDQATADLFTGIVRETDKLLWMVESHLAA